MVRKGHKLSLETRRKISVARTGKKYGGIGRAVTVKRWNSSAKKKAAAFRYGQSHKDELRAKNREYRLKNKDKYSYFAAVRRQRELGSGGFFTLQEWKNLKAQYNWVCPCCGKGEPLIKLTIDHIIPVSKGGSGNIENIQPLCGPCNSRKHTKIVPPYKKVELNNDI